MLHIACLCCWRRALAGRNSSRPPLPVQGLSSSSSGIAPFGCCAPRSTLPRRPPTDEVDHPTVTFSALRRSRRRSTPPPKKIPPPTAALHSSHFLPGAASVNAHPSLRAHRVQAQLRITAAAMLLPHWRKRTANSMFDCPLHTHPHHPSPYQRHPSSEIICSGNRPTSTGTPAFSGAFTLPIQRASFRGGGNVCPCF